MIQFDSFMQAEAPAAPAAAESDQTESKEDASC